MSSKQFAALLVATLMAVGGTVLAAMLLFSGTDGTAQADMPVEPAPPTFVEPERCRSDGAVVLGDAESALALGPPDHLEASRYAGLTGAGVEALSTCSETTTGALSQVSAAVLRYVDRVTACQAASSFIDLDGDGVGADCPADDDGVLAAVTGAREAIADAREALEATT